MKGIILTIIAFILVILLSPIGLTLGLIISIYKRNTTDYFTNVAISLDQFGNVSCKHLLDLCLIKIKGIVFGNTDETVSSVLGKNKKNNTLTVIGKWIAKDLNELEEDHVEKAVDLTQHDSYKEWLLK